MVVHITFYFLLYLQFIITNREEIAIRYLFMYLFFHSFKVSNQAGEYLNKIQV